LKFRNSSGDELLAVRDVRDSCLSKISWIFSVFVFGLVLSFGKFSVSDVSTGQGVSVLLSAKLHFFCCCFSFNSQIKISLLFKNQFRHAIGLFFRVRVLPILILFSFVTQNIFLDIPNTSFKHLNCPNFLSNTQLNQPKYFSKN